MMNLGGLPTAQVHQAPPPPGSSPVGPPLRARHAVAAGSPSRESFARIRTVVWGVTLKRTPPRTVEDGNGIDPCNKAREWPPPPRLATAAAPPPRPPSPPIAPARGRTARPPSAPDGRLTRRATSSHARPLGQFCIKLAFLPISLLTWGLGSLLWLISWCLSCLFYIFCLADYYRACVARAGEAARVDRAFTCAMRPALATFAGTAPGRPNGGAPGRVRQELGRDVLRRSKMAREEFDRARLPLVQLVSARARACAGASRAAPVPRRAPAIFDTGRARAPAQR